MKVLITGGAGFLGSVLVRGLVNRGHKVRVLDRFLYGKKPLEGLVGIEIVEGDIRDITALVRAMRGIDAVIHLACIVGDAAADLDLETTMEVNYLATKNIAELCKLYKKKLLFASTCSVYGKLLDRDVSERYRGLPRQPVSLYGRSKVMAEKAIYDLRIPYTILRLGTLFGYSPRMRFDLAINLFIAKAIKGETITLYGGDQWRPWLHVQDAANAFTMALEENWKGVFNVAWKNIQLKEVVSELRKYFSGLRVEVSKNIVDKRNYRVNFSKSLRAGFRPQRTIKEAVSEIRHAFDVGLIDDYMLPQYSNYKHLFTDVETQKKVYIKGPLGERV